jgi:hypothetical protein
MTCTVLLTRWQIMIAGGAGFALNAAVAARYASSVVRKPAVMRPASDVYVCGVAGKLTGTLPTITSVLPKPGTVGDALDALTDA